MAAYKGHLCCDFHRKSNQWSPRLDQTEENKIQLFFSRFKIVSIKIKCERHKKD